MATGEPMVGTSALADMAASALARDPAAHALDYEGRRHGWGDMARIGTRVAELVEAAGVSPGAAVALVARNRPAMVAALLGLIAADRSIQMIYAFQSPTVIARDVATLKPAAVVLMAEDLTDPVAASLREDGIAAIVLDADEARAAPGFERSRAAGEDLGERQIQVLTSGTTGPPKRFPIPFEMIARHHMGNTGMAGASEAGAAEAPPFLLSYPLGNISGIYSTIPTMLRGQPVALLDRFSLAAWRDFVVRYRPSSSGIPPTAFRMLLDADIPAEDLSSLKVMATGAAPLDPEIQRVFEDRYGIPVLLSYGATEFGGPVAALTAEHVRAFGRAKLGTVGRPLGEALLRVVDPESGAERPAGEEGLLEVVSPRIGPAWIRTSDIAVIDADGFLFIRGRADGAIIRGGFKLVPETIERALMLHPAIGAAAVVGVPDDRLGQVPAAAIQPKAGATAPAIENCVAHLRDHVPATHIPVHWRFVDDLPKNPSMKIDRPGVKALFGSSPASVSLQTDAKGRA